MKLTKSIFVFAICMALFISVNAKATGDYFLGKWNVVILGTPQGDAKVTFKFERKDGKIQGSVLDSTAKELSKITDISEKDNTITGAFSASGYDLTFELTQVDADNAKGNVINMFDAKAVRVKEEKK